MSKNKEDIEIRSEQVQEILTKVPNWMIRWGNLLLLCLILTLLLLSWFIKYPDVLVSKALITTQKPLQKIYANTTGRIDTIPVKDNELVTSNQPIAIIENNADYNDVYRLMAITNKVHIDNQTFYFPVDDFQNLSLGAIETSYALFENNYIQYALKRSNHFNNENFTNELAAPLADKKKVDVNKINHELKLLKDVILSYHQLKKDIEDWDATYVLKSRINGQVAFLNYWKKSQLVNKGDLIFTIIPSEHLGYIAKLKVPALEADKIKAGQIANLNLDNYPEAEYGILKGKILKKSLFPDKNGLYLIEVSLPKKLTTTTDKSIEFKQEISASAEIITEDLRLMERFFYRMKNVFED